MSLSPKSRLGTYELVGPLGAGGMGEVYRARDLRLGRDVAVKVLPPEVASSPDRLARFRREARAVAALNHPNIVILHSIEEAGGIHFLTLELIEGDSLASLIPPGGLPLDRLLDLALPVADALVAAHERGVIHRDLKPGNVMVSREGHVKVLDFGLAKFVTEAEPAVSDTRTQTASPPTAEGVALGTMPYMAPEQVRGGAVDGRTDVFALGVVVHELATGQRPFRGEFPIDVAHSILRVTPEPLQSLRPDLPAGLGRFIGRCLEKDPRDRFQSAREARDELRRLKGAAERGETERPVPRAASSIAVLPFVNMSGDPENEYFSDGIAEELINLLAKLRGLRVAARTSSFHFKGTTEDVSTIGRRLNVATLLEGSVRKAGDRVRIAVQLVRALDGDYLWSETYDRTLEDIFAVQDDIAQAVVTELRTTLLGREPDAGARKDVKAEVANAARGRGTDPEAHRLYLMARHFLERYTREDTKKAVERLKEALERDPGFALAWAMLGGAYVREADRGWVPVPEGSGRARKAVERALELEPDLAEGHALTGWIRMSYDWDWRGADEALTRAREAAPGNAMVLRLAGELAGTLGRHDEAIGLYRRALEQDPLSSTTYRYLGMDLHIANRLAEAEEAYRKGLELTPHMAAARALLALTLLDQGRGEEALAEARQEPEEAYRLRALAIIHHVTGQPAESVASLRALIEKYAEDDACQIAEVHAARGESDEAFEWLQRAHDHRDPGLAEMNTNPRFRSLQQDPRWVEFLAKMGF